jgi:adenylate cyclase
VHQGQGRYEQGLEACEAALALDQGSYEGNRVAGMCSMALRRYDDAIRLFERAAEVVESEFVASAFAPQCYEAKGDLAGMRAAARRALARVEKVIAAEPDHGRALGYGAGLLASLGEAERAKEWIERGTLLDPDNTILHFNFVCALARLREIEPAIDLLESVIDKGSQGWLVWLDNDTDFDPLRDQPRFIDIVQRAKARFAAGPAASA